MRTKSSHDRHQKKTRSQLLEELQRIEDQKSGAKGSPGTWVAEFLNHHQWTAGHDRIVELLSLFRRLSDRSKYRDFSQIVELLNRRLKRYRTFPQIRNTAASDSWLKLMPG